MSIPEVSVVIAADGSPEAISRCLESLRRQDQFSTAEIIVAGASADGSEDIIRTQYPEVRLLHRDGAVSTSHLIGEALRQARGRIIILTDIHCRVPVDWLGRIQKAHQTGFPIIGGAVENDNPGGLLNWARFYADYAAFVLPAKRKVTPVLAGNHLSYKRWVIERHLNSTPDHFFKVFFHWDLMKAGVQFLFDPELVVYYRRDETFWAFLRRYYCNAYRFAVLRSNRISAINRWIRVIAAPALPAILLYQRLGAAARKKGHRLRLLVSVPLLAAFVTAWAMGEFMGYLCGSGKLSSRFSAESQAICGECE